MTATGERWGGGEEKRRGVAGKAETGGGGESGDGGWREEKTNGGVGDCGTVAAPWGQQHETNYPMRL